MISLAQIEAFAALIEQAGDWVTANWIRCQAQEIQVEIERFLACRSG